MAMTQANRYTRTRDEMLSCAEARCICISIADRKESHFGNFAPEFRVLFALYHQH